MSEQAVEWIAPPEPGHASFFTLPPSPYHVLIRAFTRDFQGLANRGIFPGVEYRILEISVSTDPDSESESQSESKLESKPDSETVSDAEAEAEAEVEAEAKAERYSYSESEFTDPLPLASAREAPEGAFDGGVLVFTMRPVYPLVKRLERPWPVQVPAREFPVLLTPFSYNAATAWAALTTSLSLLATGFVLSQALTLSFIPSHSMEPTLQARRLSFL